MSLAESKEIQGTVLYKYQYGPNLILEYVDPAQRISMSRHRPATTLVKEIVYQTIDGKSLKLSSLLPPGFTFRVAEATGSPRCGQNEITYCRNSDFPYLDSHLVLQRGAGLFFEKPGSLFGLLTEICHAKKTALLSDKEKVTNFMPDFLLSAQERRDRVPFNIQEERDTAAYALSKLLTFRQSGIDLEPEIKTKTQLQWLVYIPIISHELEELSKLGNKEVNIWLKHRRREVVTAVKNKNFDKIIRDSYRPLRGLEFNLSILDKLISLF